MKRKTLVFLALFFVFLLIIIRPVSADYRSRVLGASTVSGLEIPPTIEGPGLILPDSPLFFLDQIKQAVRINTAFTSEAKAKIYAEIAGERLAELRFMLVKNDKQAAEFALKGVADNFQSAADELSQAKLRGKDVSVLAKEINDDIKLKQQTLDILESKAQGEVKIKVLSAQESIVVAKIKTEEALSQPELESEINYDLNRQIDKQVNQVLESTELLKNDVKELSIQASEAARSNLTRREEALKKAMAEKNDSLKKEQERLLTLEKIKNQKLSQLEGREAVEVMETVKKAQEAAIRIQKTREQVKEIKSQNTSVSSSANIKD